MKALDKENYHAHIKVMGGCTMRTILTTFYSLIRVIYYTARMFINLHICFMITL